MRQVQRRLQSRSSFHNDQQTTNDDDTQTAQYIVARAQETARAVFDTEKPANTAATTHTKPATTAPTSFSLLDQFTASPPFSWSMIPDPGTQIPETLALLHKVEYLEDVFPDWEASIRPFLRDHLLVSQQQHAEAILTLYATWYAKVRAALQEFESKSLACDVVCDLLDVVQHADHDVQKSSLQLALDMFLDMMVHGSFPAQRTDPIGDSIYALSDSAVLYSLVRDIDPFAQCLRQWIPASCRTSSSTLLLSLLPVLDTQPTILPQVLARCCQQYDIYALSTLRSVLVATRVRSFPWEQVATTPSQVLGLFLQGLLSHVRVDANSDDDPADDAVIPIYMEGLDTIRSGLLSFDADQRREALQEHQETIQRIQSQLRSHALEHHLFPLGTLPCLLQEMVLPP